MKTKKLDFLVYVHGALLLWFALFAGSLFLQDGGNTASVLAIGNVLFLLANIPLGILSLIWTAKDRFSPRFKVPVAILSVLNILVSVAVWIFAVMLLQMP